VFDLQTVVQSESEPVRPVKQWERTEDEQIYPSNRVSRQRQQALIPRPFEPSQGERQSEQEQMNGHQYRGNNSARAEEQPKEWFVGSLGHLPSQKKPNNNRGCDDPENIIRSRNRNTGNALAAHTNRHRLGSKIEPCYSVKHYEEKAD
jgi:hypothetical protein